MQIRAAFTLGLLLAIPTAARAVTLTEIVSLSQAGVGDEVLIALIDADRSTFTMTPALIAVLHARGVGERVIVKMIRTQEEFGAPNFLVIGVPAPAAPAPAAIPILVPVPVPIATEVIRGGDRMEPHEHRESRTPPKKDRTEDERHRGGRVAAGLRIRNGEFVR